MIKLGIFGCRAENIGLGAQTWELFRHMQPYRTVVVDLSRMNKNKLYSERFPGAMFTRIMPRPFEIQNFVPGLSHVFCCETSYDVDLKGILFEQCNRRNIKSILQFNYEFFEWFQKPNLPRPTVLASPSYWKLEYMQQNYGAVYLPVPINREVLPFVRKHQFKRFLHIAGIRVDHDRNGTEETLQAFKMLNRDDIHLTVKCQNPGWSTDWKNRFGCANIEIDGSNCDNYYDNHKGFDCLIMPRKYGGLCLPMQEALSCGMPVIMTDVSPNDRVLPKEWLIPCHRTGDFQARTTIDIYSADINALASKIADLADMNTEQAGAESDKADAIAAELDWKIWKGKYLEFFQSL